MPEQPEEGFSFEDKRRTAQPEPSPIDPEELTDDDIEPGIGADGQGGHPRLNARDRLLMCIDILGQGAWISLGLHTDPVTQQVEKNLAEARAQIDAVAALAQAVDSMVEPDLQRELRRLVGDLRANWVNQSR